MARIVKQSEGDLRNAIVTLQYISKLAIAMASDTISLQIY